MKYLTTELSDFFLNIFLDLVRLPSASNPLSQTCPSTEVQWDVLHRIKKEIESLGGFELSLDENGYLKAVLPGRTDCAVTGFMAHVDVSPDAPSVGVKPSIIRNYDGKPLELSDKVILDPELFPQLQEAVGLTLITTDGKTLLGSDDKSGCAIILTIMKYLSMNPQFNHGTLEFYFTPDEEIGRGMDKFPLKKSQAEYLYTFDGDSLGTVESSCFNAYKVEARIKGKVIHPGQARGKLVNAVQLAGEFLSRIPAEESPQATDGQYGFYCPVSVSGTMDESTVELIIRDFDDTEAVRRCDALKAMARALELAWKGSMIEIKIKKQYSNMMEFIQRNPVGMERLKQAVADLGIETVEKSIRGGTDGSRLSEMGIPTPNIFTGGGNFHSVKEFLVLETALKAAETGLRLIELWADA